MSRRIESPSTYGVYGYRNIWGGFHSTTDAYAYRGLFLLALRRPREARFALKFARTVIWRHRRCDTTDFHHWACTLDPYGKKVDDDYRWQRAWTGQR